MTRKKWRLIVNRIPATGAWNMAVDEFLFRRLTDEPVTIVRFYRWARPTVSLGFGQKTARVVDLEFCRLNGVDVVRRPTGGKLVLHDREVTYAVVSSDAEMFTSTLGGSYQWISQGLVKGLEAFGLKPSLAGETPRDYVKGTMPCFSQPARNEIELDGRKIIGSAQKRTGNRFLQHGSIPLAGDEDLLRAVSLRKEDPSKILMTSLSEALDRPVSFDEAVDRFIGGLASFGGIDFKPFAFGKEERAAIESLRLRKYATEAWTVDGQEIDPPAARS